MLVALLGVVAGTLVLLSMRGGTVLVFLGDIFGVLVLLSPIFYWIGREHHKDQIMAQFWNEKFKTGEIMIKRLIIALFAATILVVAGSGCRTAHGAGEDMEKAGEKVQENTPP